MTKKVYADEDPEVMAALAFAHRHVVSEADSIEQKVLANFTVQELDPDTFSRHRGKYADLRSFTEATCDGDSSVETDLSAALAKRGVERISSLQALREKLGRGSHRKQQLADLMLLYLLSEKTTNPPVKDSVRGACKDFITQGHDESEAFMKRCKEGQSSISKARFSAERDAAVAGGLMAIKNRYKCECLVMGITLKLGYSDKPSCDLSGLLGTFENIKQKKEESTNNYINRFETVIDKLASATALMQKQNHMPNEGAWLVQLKKGAKDEIRKKANNILQDIKNIPLDQATYIQMTAALREAEKKITAEADEERAMKGASKPPPTPLSPSTDAEKTDNEQAEDLTHLLRDQRVCVKFVANALGSGEPCNCTKHLHKLPSQMGLQDSDYKGFVVIPHHLTTQSSLETRLKSQALGLRTPALQTRLVGNARCH